MLISYQFKGQHTTTYQPPCRLRAGRKGNTMKRIEIAEGITLTATQSTIDAYEREKRAAEAEAELIQWLATTDPHTEGYSDVYKDVYGVRPRWLY